MVDFWLFFLILEDIGAYGRDINTNIVLLLKSILPVLESEPQAMLRIGMTNPPYILEHLQDIAAILNHKQVYSFLHVPVQAGSTQVLEHMKRLYTIDDFYTVCDTLCEQVKGITIATDIICGH